MIDAETTQGPHKLDIALGGVIRRRRKGLGLSQTALAQAVGITFQQIQKYERGTNRVSFSRLAAIAKALDCQPADLIAGLDDETASNPMALPPDEAELMAAYALAPLPVRRAVLGVLAAVTRLRAKSH